MGSKILILQKPAARDRIEQIENWLEENTNKILAEKDVLVDSWRIGEHYKEFIGKDFYPAMIKYWTGKKVRAWIVEVEDVKKFKEMVGNPKGTTGFRSELMHDRIQKIKEEFGVVDNGIHASDSIENGKREIRLWFGVPSLAKIYDHPKQQKTDSIHRKIYTTLQRLATNLGADVLFAGGTHNGLAIPENNVDLDYRILCQDDKVQEIAKKISSEFPEMKWDKEGIDPKTKSPYVKYEIEFDGGKADVAFVPISAYKDKISSSHLAALLSPEELEGFRTRKSTAFLQGKEQYKKEKEKIRGEIDEHPWWKSITGDRPDKKIEDHNLNFSEWLELQENILPIKQTFVNWEDGVREANNKKQLLNVLLDATLRHARSEGKVYVDIKTKDSILEKIKRGKAPEEITDYLRGAIVLNNKQRVKEAVQYLNNRSNVVKWEFKNTPKIGDRMGYRGSYHLDINLGGLICEVQIMTKSLWKLKDAAHAVYAVERGGNEAPVSSVSTLYRAFRREGENRGKKDDPGLDRNELRRKRKLHRHGEGEIIRRSAEEN